MPAGFAPLSAGLAFWLCSNLAGALKSPGSPQTDVRRCDPFENVFVINVKGEAGEVRRKSIKQQLNEAGVTKYEFFDAYDVRSMPYPQILEQGEAIRKKDGHPRISAGDAALSISHRQIYERILQQQLPCALIFEDDVKITANFRHRLTEAPFWNNESFKSFSLLKVDYCCFRGQAKGPADQSSIPEIRGGAGGPVTSGYVVSLQGAAILKQANTPLWMNPDGNLDPNHMRYTEAAPRLPDYKMFHVFPPMVWQGNEAMPGGKELHLALEKPEKLASIGMDPFAIRKLYLQEAEEANPELSLAMLGECGAQEA